MKGRASIAVLILLAALPALPMSIEERVDLFNEANALFREANEASTQNPAEARELYRRAALRYERIAREGNIQNGKLFYNIGNAYFRAEDLGRAILYYRRAKLFMPDNANLLQNLQFARSRRLDRFEETEEMKILRTLLFWHYDLAPGVRSTIFLVFSGVFWIAAAIRLRRGELIPKWLLLASGLLSALFFGSLLADSTAGAGRNSGVIIAQQVVARKGDGNSYEPSFTEPLHAGTEFRLGEEREEWLQVELPDGRRCWIPVDAAALVGRI